MEKPGAVGTSDRTVTFSVQSIFLLARQQDYLLEASRAGLVRTAVRHPLRLRGVLWRQW